jgi:hypothetical protein
LSRNEDVMSKGTIHNISNIAELENPTRVERHNFSDGQPTVADLVLPGTGYKFSDEFACVLGVPGGEREFA